MQDILLDLEEDVLWVKLQPEVQIRDYYEDGAGNRYKPEKIDEQFAVDVSYFRTGRYSYMSEGAKERILETSNMIYNYVDSTGRAFSDVKMLGLLRHPRLKEELEAQIEITLSDHDELLPAPKDEWFLLSARLTRVQ